MDISEWYLVAKFMLVNKTYPRGKPSLFTSNTEHTLNRHSGNYTSRWRKMKVCDVISYKMSVAPTYDETNLWELQAKRPLEKLSRVSGYIVYSISLQLDFRTMLFSPAKNRRSVLGQWNYWSTVGLGTVSRNPRTKVHINVFLGYLFLVFPCCIIDLMLRCA